MVPWGGPCRGRAPNVLLPLGGRYLGPLLMLMSQKREMKGCLPHMVSLSSLSCLPELRVPVCSEGSICPPPRPGAASPSGQFLLGVDSLPPFPLSDNLIAFHITPSTSRPLEVTTHTLPKAEPSGALVLTEPRAPAQLWPWTTYSHVGGEGIAEGVGMGVPGLGSWKVGGKRGTPG